MYRPLTIKRQHFKVVAGAAFFGCIAMTLGCMRTEPTDPATRSQRAESVSLIDGKVRSYESLPEYDVMQFVKLADRPVLVEFGVDMHCARCEQMAPLVNELATQFDGRVHVVRARFSPSSALQVELGVRHCPSYRIFDGGSLVDHYDGPTLLPVLQSSLSSLLARDSRPSAAELLSTERIEVAP